MTASERPGTPPPQPPLRGWFATLADALEAAAAQHGDRTAIVDRASADAVRLSFREWHRRSDSLAAQIAEHGVGPGDVVAILMPSSADFAVAYGAITLAGGVVTAINPRLGRREIAAILDRADPALILIDRASVADFPVPARAVIERSELRTDGPSLGERRPRLTEADPAVIVWTSGTTGTPKGAWFDHRNLRAAVASAGPMACPYDVRLVVTPFAHAGYMAKPWEQLAWGVSLVIAPTPWSAAEMLRLMVDERVTFAGGAPTQWFKLLEEPGLADADLSCIRLGGVAMAPASPELVERVSRATGAPLIVRYSMTESPSVSGTHPEDPPDVQYRTVGRAVTGMELEVVDDHGRPAPVDTVGRIRVRGECVMRGYWRDPVLTATAFDEDGWLATSDLGRIDADGNLRLAGRASEMYIRGGYNVYPIEVENVLAEHPKVERAAVVGTPAPVIGEIGVAFVIPADPSEPPTLAELRTWVAADLADYKAPDRLVVVDEFPLTAMMKIDKATLAHRASETTDDRSSSTPAPT